MEAPVGATRWRRAIPKSSGPEDHSFRISGVI